MVLGHRMDLVASDSHGHLSASSIRSRLPVSLRVDARAATSAHELYA